MLLQTLKAYLKTAKNLHNMSYVYPQSSFLWQYIPSGGNASNAALMIFLISRFQLCKIMFIQIISAFDSSSFKKSPDTTVMCFSKSYFFTLFFAINAIRLMAFCYSYYIHFNCLSLFCRNAGNTCLALFGYSLLGICLYWILFLVHKIPICVVVKLFCNICG